MNKKNPLAQNIPEKSATNDVAIDKRADMMEVTAMDAAELQRYLESFKWGLGKLKVKATGRIEEHCKDDGGREFTKIELVDAAGTAKILKVYDDKQNAFKRAIQKRTDGDLCIKFNVRNPLSISFKDIIRYWKRFPVEVLYDFYKKQDGRISEFPTIMIWFPEDFVDNKKEGGNWITI